jgi:Glycosyltransferases, probably involved in cell wall biogenesis
MAHITPYIIIHVHLESEHDIYSRVKEDGRYYLLFWWEQIPLGQLTIEEGETMDANSLQLKIIRAIQPCIEFYKSKSGLIMNSYISAFLKNDYGQFLTVMDKIFSDQQVNSLPKILNVSVVICTCNRPKELNRFMNSLVNQVFPVTEIIVVDNAPSDDTTRQVIEKFEQAIYYREEKKGLSIARNAGLRLATAQIIAFSDDDVVLHPLWSYRVWETFLSPEVKAMTGLTIALNLETESQQIFEKYWSFNRGYEEKEFNYDFIEDNLKAGPPVWMIGAGANMAFRKSIFDAIGCFDERLGAGSSGCSEDSEIWYRILLRGFCISYNPRAVAYHEHRKEIRALKKQMYSYARGHVVAALIQQNLNKNAGYKKRVFVEYPVFYLRRLIKGFPKYQHKNRTLFSEILGWRSGIVFFKRKCKTLPKAMGPGRLIITDVAQKPQAI